MEKEIRRRGKDLKPRHRRTKAEIEQVRKEMAERVQQNIINNAKKELEGKYYLVSKQLLDVANISYEDLMTFLKKSAVERFQSIINE